MTPPALEDIECIPVDAGTVQQAKGDPGAHAPTRWRLDAISAYVLIFEMMTPRSTVGDAPTKVGGALPTVSLS
jgi:hypothetical protein